MSANREDYFDFLRENSEVVRPQLARFIEAAGEAAPELCSAMMVIGERRLDQPLQKPGLVRLAYEICGGKNWEQIVPAAVAFELLNISSYQANASFDNKCGAFSKSDKDSQVIASMLSRELAIRAVQDLQCSFPPPLIVRVQEAISFSNYNIYLAQHYDLNLLTFNNLARYDNECPFLEDYRKRCYLGSGIINGQCAFVGALLAGADVDKSDALRQFGEHFGTGLQIVNDLADFVSPLIDPFVVGKHYQDSMSDLKNGRLTLPLFHQLKLAGKEAAKVIRLAFEQKQFDSITARSIVDSLVREGSAAYTERFASESATAARRQLDLFPDTTPRRNLITMASIVETNKYFVAIHKRNAHVAHGKGQRSKL